MALQLIYLVFSKLVSWMVLRTRSDTAKEIEILAPWPSATRNPDLAARWVPAALGRPRTGSAYGGKDTDFGRRFVYRRGRARARAVSSAPVGRHGD